MSVDIFYIGSDKNQKRQKSLCNKKINLGKNKITAAKLLESINVK